MHVGHMHLVWRVVAGVASTATVALAQPASDYDFDFVTIGAPGNPMRTNSSSLRRATNRLLAAIRSVPSRNPPWHLAADPSRACNEGAMHARRRVPEDRPYPIHAACAPPASRTPSHEHAPANALQGPAAFVVRRDRGRVARVNGALPVRSRSGQHGAIMRANAERAVK